LDSKLLSIVAVGFAAFAPGRAWSDDPTYSFAGDFDGRLAEHVHVPRDTASQRLELQFDGKAKWQDWNAVAGVRGWDEGAYSEDPSRYPVPLIEADTTDLRFRDLYLQHDIGGLMFRFGNQQVIWGEAFGYFYSDIVNPKDLRDGAFGDLSEVRLQTPIANIKYVSENFSIQGILIPKPFFNIMPLPGSDFSIPYNSLPFGSVTINRQESLPIGNVEGGGRISYLADRLDLSVFYLNYYDRTPYYAVDPSTAFPGSLVLDEQHSRVQSAGITATDELGGFVLRFEGLTTLNRQIPVLLGSTLSTTLTHQYVYVAGLDLPTLEQFNVGFQWSQDVLWQQASYLTRNQSENLISVHLERPFFLKQTADLIYTYEVSDGGSRLEAVYTLPLSNSVETRWGVDLLNGGPSTDFGRVSGGSRAYVLIKCFFSG
jgi:hypothetical protein